MTALSTRPASSADAADAAFEDLLPDRWREGGNRRSMVATGATGLVLGHCRGIDNDFHPGSRTLVLEVAHGAPWTEVADALLEAQIRVSTLPLQVKPSAHETALLDLCARHGGVLVQLMPPWRYVVDTAMREWAVAHRSTADGLRAEPVGDARREDLLDLYVEHYTAQHVRWSPAAAPTRLRAENAPDFVPGAEGSFDPRRSTLLRRDRALVAQALAWPPAPDGGVEITLQHRPHEGPTAREDMEACLAAVIAASSDGDVLLIDSHVTEELESATMRELPGPPPHPKDSWTAIVAIPVSGGPAPIPLPAERIPEGAAELASRLGVITRDGANPPRPGSVTAC